MAAWSSCSSRDKVYEDWSCEALPAAPQELPLGSHRAYTLAAGTATASGYDISRRAWAKQTDWVIPFSALAEYVPEYELWFGSRGIGKVTPCAPVTSPPPATAGVLRRCCATSGSTTSSRARCGCRIPPNSYVHLGSARFCIVRIFGKPSSECQSVWGWDDPPNREEVFAVLTAVQVVRSGEWGRGLRMVKHKSVRYSLGECYSLAPLTVF
ncbi:hypothetical protein E2562_010757 [Oryza meyeriana var. granulata]|uniref:Uncharacterized protein n=1 Tax=Oryza meyeriana var. granulata TaxID=110450 RepID=A0A6G1EW90_9ORYZ|nr:hypothetical protein E2562_010757 [Oryza meyeriana var. granulata]